MDFIYYLAVCAVSWFFCFVEICHWFCLISSNLYLNSHERNTKCAMWCFQNDHDVCWKFASWHVETGFLLHNHCLFVFPLQKKTLFVFHDQTRVYVIYMHEFLCMWILTFRPNQSHLRFPLELKLKIVIYVVTLVVSCSLSSISAFCCLNFRCTFIISM